MDEQTDKRLIDLESTLGLLQHDFEAQNEMILLNTKLINTLEKKLERIQAELDSVKQDEGPESPEDQVPPHY